MVCVCVWRDAGCTIPHLTVQRMSREMYACNIPCSCPYAPVLSSALTWSLAGEMPVNKDSPFLLSLLCLWGEHWYSYCKWRMYKGRCCSELGLRFRPMCFSFKGAKSFKEPGWQCCIAAVGTMYPSPISEPHEGRTLTIKPQTGAWRGRWQGWGKRCVCVCGGVPTESTSPEGVCKESAKR